MKQRSIAIFTRQLATMLDLSDMKTFEMPAGQEAGVGMQQVLDWFTTNEVSRMPVVDAGREAASRDDLLSMGVCSPDAA